MEKLLQKVCSNPSCIDVILKSKNFQWYQQLRIMKSMIIKDIALWELENSEILPRSKHNNVLQQYKTQNNIILSWYEFKF